MNYVEIPATDQVNHKHLRQGQIAILADAIGSSEIINFSCRSCDHDMFSMVADTVLMLDVEKWIRGLPAHAGARADQDAMQLSPSKGVNITFDRYVMTVDGFIPKREFVEYKVRKRIEMFKELSRQGKLYVCNRP